MIEDEEELLATGTPVSVLGYSIKYCNVYYHHIK